MWINMAYIGSWNHFLFVFVCVCVSLSLYLSLYLSFCKSSSPSMSSPDMCLYIYDLPCFYPVVVLFCVLFNDCSRYGRRIHQPFIVAGRTLPSRQDPHNTAQLNNPTRPYFIHCSVCLAKEIWIEISSLMFALYVAWLLVFIHCWAKAWCWMKSRMFNQPEYFVRFQKHLKFQLWWWS